MQSYEDSILALELTDHCNCRCVMCTQSVLSVIHGHSKGFMDKQLVTKILKDLHRQGVTMGKLLPFGLGESTLHPDFSEIMEEIFSVNRQQKTFGWIDLHTNAIAFTAEKQKLLLENADQIGSLTFSLDAVRSETFAKIRGSNQFNQARQHVLEFLDLRKKMRQTSPNVIFQFIVMQENKQDALPFLNFWRTHLEKLEVPFQINFDWSPPMTKDTIFFKRVNPFSRMDFMAAEYLHRQVISNLALLPNSTNKTEERHINSDEYTEEMNIIRRPCSGPFKYINIAWDGVVTVCCIDTERKLALGTISDSTPLTKLWEGSLNHKYRIAHITGDLSDIPTCQNCRNLDGPSISDNEILQWLHKKHLIVEANQYRRRMRLE